MIEFSLPVPLIETSLRRLAEIEWPESRLNYLAFLIVVVVVILVQRDVTLSCTIGYNL